MKKGKRYLEVIKNVDRTKLYDTDEAIKLVKENATAKFDETIEVRSEERRVGKECRSRRSPDH